MNSSLPAPSWASPHGESTLRRSTTAIFRLTTLFNRSSRQTCPLNPTGNPDQAGIQRDPGKGYIGGIGWAPYGGGRIQGSGSPSPSSGPRAIASESGSSRNAIGGSDDRAGARAGGAVASPRCRRILPTTAGSVRKASTTMGNVHVDVEHRGQASASTCSKRRRSCAHGTRRRGGGDGLSFSTRAACFVSASRPGSVPVSTAVHSSRTGGAGKNLRRRLRLAKMP